MTEINYSIQKEVTLILHSYRPAIDVGSFYTIFRFRGISNYMHKFTVVITMSRMASSANASGQTRLLVFAATRAVGGGPSGNLVTSSQTTTVTLEE